LPANITVAVLPELPLAAQYPTIGPQGEFNMNVNGLAASIELFLGVDVLTDAGALRPIRWTGFSQGAQRYQGEVMSRAAIQTAFRNKVATAERDPATIAQQDWSGIDLALDHIVAVLSPRAQA